MRSKFQTSRRMSNATQGEPVEVPFDETIVKYYWVEERVFDVVEIEMRQKNKGLLIEKAVLTAVEIADAADAEVDIPVLLQAISQQQQGAEEVDEGESSGSADEGKTWKVVMEEGEEQVFEEGAY